MKLYCKFCKHCKYDQALEDHCCENDFIEISYPETYYEPAHVVRCKSINTKCSDKNKNWDCKDYEVGPIPRS